MKIALVSGSYPDMPCGVGDHTARLAQALSQRGHEVRVLTSRDRRVRRDGRALPVVDGWGAGEERVIARAAAGADILHFQTPALGYGRSPWARRLPFSKRVGLPVVSTIHEYSALHWLHRWATRPVLKGSRALIMPGEADAREIAARWPKVTWIPVGTNILPSDPCPRRRDESACFFGTAYRGKGLEAFLAAKDGLPATVVGHVHPDYRSAWDALRRRYRRGMQWTGGLPEAEVSEILSTCGVCVLPYEEGASLRRTTLAAALAHGTPVVTTRPRVAIEGLDEAAVLVGRADPALIAPAIRRVLNDADLRARLSRGALRLAKRLSWDSIAERTEEVYRRCLAETRQSGYN